MVLDTSIRDNNRRERVRRNLGSDTIKVFYMILDILSIRMKRKLIWERVYEFIPQRKLFIKR